MKTGFSMIGLLLLATAAVAGEMRNWTFGQSGKTVKAELVAFTGDSVTLKDTEGKTISVPIAYLNDSDRSYLAAERPKQWKKIEVVKLESAESAGRYKRCTVRGSGLNGEVYLQRLPQAAEAILNNRNAQAAQIASLSNRIELKNRAVKQAKAATPPTASVNRAYRRAVAAEHAQINQEARDVKTSQANLSKLRKSYEDSISKTREQTTVKMRNTGQEYKGLAIWECSSENGNGKR